MNSTLKRVLSAAIAILLLGFIFYTWGTQGLIVGSIGIALKMQLEYARLMFSKKYGWGVKGCFVFGSFVTLLIALYSPVYLTAALALIGLMMISLFLFGLNDNEDLQQVLYYQGLVILGLFYCSLLPYMIIKTLMFERGLVWFLTLLAIVFSGDIGAYFVGRTFGTTKIAPVISPHKTWAGAFGGLAASAGAGALAAIYFFPEVPFIFFLIFAILMGAFAQIGDFFESLIKRVAGVKDSGTIMPGHGGALDRLDGILFAAPLIFFLALRYYHALV